MSAVMKAPALSLVLWLAVGGACEQQRPAASARVDATVERPPQRMGTAGGANQSTSAHTGAPDAAVADAAPEDAAALAANGASDDDRLVGEEREPDPRSGTIEIKVIVAERRQAHVIWGRKDFGVAPLEIERPRDSGPLDLVVIAPGYLPYHARAFTDRDDTVMVHLYSAAEAPQLLGYRASEVRKGKTSTTSATSTSSASSAVGSTPASIQNHQKSR